MDNGKKKGGNESGRDRKKWRKIESGREKKENEIVKTESGRVLDKN